MKAIQAGLMNYSTKLLRMNDVVELTSLSRSTIDRLEKGGAFPKRRQIGVRAVGWLECEVHSWISESNQRFHCGSKGQANSEGAVINSVNQRLSAGGADE